MNPTETAPVPAPVPVPVPETETETETETAATLLVAINRHCHEIGSIHDGYRDMGTYGCAGEAAEIMSLVGRLRALLGLPS